MGKKRQPPPQVPSSPSDDSEEEPMKIDQEQQGFLRSDDDSEEDSDTEEEAGVAGPKSSTKVTQEQPEEPTSESDASSASGGKFPTSSDGFIVLQRNPERIGKPTSAESLSKQNPQEVTPKARKSDVLKRPNAGEGDRKAFIKKQKKEMTVRSSKSDESPVSPPKDKLLKKQGKKSGLKTASVTGEMAKSAPSTLQASKTLENRPTENTEEDKSDKTEKKKRKIKSESTGKLAKSEKLETEQSEKIDKTEKGQNSKKISKDSQDPSSLSKPKLWTPKEEILLTKALSSTRQGMEIPTKQTDEFRTKLIKNLEGKLEGGWSKEQIFEKIRRMKARYVTMAGNIQNTEKQFKFRNANDEELFGLWDQIWGSGDKAKVDEEMTNERHTTSTFPSSQTKDKLLHEGVSNNSTVLIDTSKLIQNKDAENLKDDSPESDESGEDDDSESEETDKHTSSQENKLKVIEMDLEQNGISNGENGDNNKSMSDVRSIIQCDIRESLSGLQENVTRMLKDLQTKTLGMVENALKTSASQSRIMNGSSLGLQGLDHFFSGSINMMSLHTAVDDEGFQQQWYEQHLQELKVYRQRLELIRKECQLKEDQLKLHLERSK